KGKIPMGGLFARTQPRNGGQLRASTLFAGNDPDAGPRGRRFKSLATRNKDFPPGSLAVASCQLTGPVVATRYPWPDFNLRRLVDFAELLWSAANSAYGAEHALRSRTGQLQYRCGRDWASADSSTPKADKNRARPAPRSPAGRP